MLSDAEMISMRDNAAESLHKLYVENNIKKRKKIETDLIKLITKYPTTLPRCIHQQWTNFVIKSTRNYLGSNEDNQQLFEFDEINEPEYGLGILFILIELANFQERSPPPEFEIGRVEQSPHHQNLMPWYTFMAFII